MIIQKNLNLVEYVGENLREFLEPTAYCESGDPEIRQLGSEITKGKKTDTDRAKAIFEWVKENVKYDIVPLVGAKKVIKRQSKFAMCYDKTNLFVAICRSIGVPARYMILDCDLKVNRNDISPKAKHIAAEVYVDGKWTLTDPSFEDEIESLIEPSKFGSPTWVSGRNIKRTKSLSRIMVFLVNTILIHLPFFKKLKQAIREARASYA